MNAAALLRFSAFVKEREAVRLRKEQGDPWPWTKDPILQQYRFCNIRREDDKESRLIYDNWIAPHAADPDLWFACAVARLINWWPSLEAVGYPVPWGQGQKRFLKELNFRKTTGQKIFTGAYMIRADPHVSGNKHAYIAEQVLSPMWAARAELRPRPQDTLRAFHARLLTCRDVGPFIAGQFVADAKRGEGPLKYAPDFYTWATEGPGSLRGLARLYGRDYNYRWGPGEWQRDFKRFQLIYENPFKLDGQNLNSALCETDKYERVRLGQGRPRSRYNAPSTTV